MTVKDIAQTKVLREEVAELGGTLEALQKTISTMENTAMAKDHALQQQQTDLDAAVEGHTAADKAQRAAEEQLVTVRNTLLRVETSQQQLQETCHTLSAEVQHQRSDLGDTDEELRRTKEALKVATGLVHGFETAFAVATKQMTLIDRSIKTEGGGAGLLEGLQGGHQGGLQGESSTAAAGVDVPTDISTDISTDLLSTDIPTDISTDISTDRVAAVRARLANDASGANSGERSPPDLTEGTGAGTGVGAAAGAGAGATETGAVAAAAGAEKRSVSLVPPCHSLHPLHPLHPLLPLRPRHPLRRCHSKSLRDFPPRKISPSQLLIY